MIFLFETKSKLSNFVSILLKMFPVRELYSVRIDWQTRRGSPELELLKIWSDHYWNRIQLFSVQNLNLVALKLRHLNCDWSHAKITCCLSIAFSRNFHLEKCYWFVEEKQYPLFVLWPIKIFLCLFKERKPQTFKDITLKSVFVSICFND